MDSSLSALHVLHLLLLRLCWQMPPPPNSLHVLFIRLCWQMLPPPMLPPPTAATGSMSLPDLSMFHTSNLKAESRNPLP